MRGVAKIKFSRKLAWGGFWDPFWEHFGRLGIDFGLILGVWRSFLVVWKGPGRRPGNHMILGGPEQDQESQEGWSGVVISVVFGAQYQQITDG